VAVSFRKLNRGVQIQIQDNGKAFHVDRQLSANGKKRLGLLGMQERARLVDGRFDIRSAPGKGTTVSVAIPFKTASELTAGKTISSKEPEMFCDRKTMTPV